jgi:predicted P-loop ATPase/GTPase
LGVLFILVFNLACYSLEEREAIQSEHDKQVQVCREYLKKSDYIITNSLNKYQYQTDNYTIDSIGNLTMPKYVIVRSDRGSDYTIYKTKLIIASGLYMIEWLK